MKRHVTGMAAAVASAVIGVSSQAATNIAELQHIAFSFVDLNPGDGIGPDLIPTEVESGFSFIVDGYSPGGPGDTADGFLTALPIVIPFGEEPNAGASGSMTPSVSITVEADATGAGTAMIDGGSAGSWFVTPYTSVTMTADSLFQSTASAGSESASICLDSTCSSFESSANGTIAHSYSVTYTNDTAQFMGIFLTVDDNAEAAEIPEPPASWLFLAAGAAFGLLASKTGRRAR
jgi:hypothetical protein